MNFNITFKPILVRTVLLSIVICGICSSGIASPACNTPALHSPGYARSIKLVSRLSELAAWSRSHDFPVAYGEFTDKQELLHGHCYWSVSVYAHRPERLELWNVFYVGVTNRHLLVQDSVSGKAMPLQKWRLMQKNV